MFINFYSDFYCLELVFNGIEFHNQISVKKYRRFPESFLSITEEFTFSIVNIIAQNPHSNFRIND